MAPTIVQVPPSELAKAKQQLESERIQLAKQRREIQSSQNKAAAVKQAIGVGVAIGTGALALYKLNEKKKSDAANLAAKEADRAQRAEESEWRRQDAIAQQELRRQDAIAQQELRRQTVQGRLEAIAQQELRRQTVQGRLDAISQRQEDGQKQITAYQAIKDVVPGIARSIDWTARATGNTVMVAGRAVDRGVRTVAYVGQNLANIGAGALALTGAGMYMYPPLRQSIPRSVGEATGEAAVSIPLEFIKGVPVGMYKSAQRGFAPVLESFRQTDPYLAEVRRADEREADRARAAEEEKARAQIPPQFFGNLNSTIPLTNVTYEEVLRAYTNTARSAETGEGIPYIPMDFSKFPKRGAFWTKDLFDEYQKSSVLEKQEIESRLPRGTLTYLNRKYSRSR